MSKRGLTVNFSDNAPLLIEGFCCSWLMMLLVVFIINIFFILFYK